jgi:hypothetical protein
VFAHDDGSVAVAWSSDLAFAASAGAALTVTPQSVVDEHLRTESLDGHVLENYVEVMNVAAGALNRVSYRHVRLVGVHVTPGEPLSEDAGALLDGPGSRVDMEVDIPGYSGGFCSILA